MATGKGEIKFGHVGQLGNILEAKQTRRLDREGNWILDTPSSAARMTPLDGVSDSPRRSRSQGRSSQVTQFPFACRHAVRKFVTILFLMLVWSPVRAKVKRHDTVVMKNGDRLTGEVKRLQSGVLYIETDYMSGSIGLDWKQVETVQSTATFQVVLDDGRRVIGLIEKISGQSAPGEDFAIRQSQGERRTDAHDVVDIEPQKSSFWRQLKGSFDLGYSLTSGNSQHQASASANASYLTTRWSAAGSFDSSVGGQSGGSQTNKQDGQLS